MFRFPFFRISLAVSVCAAFLTGSAQDFSIDTDHADGAISWQGTKLIQPVFRPADGSENYFGRESRKRVDTLTDKREVVNFFGDSPTQWRVESALSPDGKELEYTFGTSCEAYFANPGSCTFELRIPWSAIAGKKYKLFHGRRNGIVPAEGVFDDSFAKYDWVRYIAVGDGTTPGPVLDLNPRGTTAYDSDQWTTTGRGSWFVNREKDDLVIHLTFSLPESGNYFGTKFRFFTGVFDDYYKRHARLHYMYMSEFSFQYLFSFGSEKHGKQYMPADQTQFQNGGGVGWLNGFTPELVTESPEGAYYAHAQGKTPAVFRMAKLNPGFYVVNVGAGNLKGLDAAFSVALNGHNMIENFTLPAGKACDLTQVVHSVDGRIDVELSGDWKLSTLMIQPLLNDWEDCIFQRGVWLIDEKEPLLGMSPNAGVKAPAVFTVAKEIYTLPVPGTEMSAPRKAFVRESAVPDASRPETQWQKELRIGSFGENMSAIAAWLPAGAAEKKIDFFEKQGKNFVIHNGIFSRHLYPNEAAASEIPVLKRLCSAAHTKNMHILDHQDYGLLWDCGAGFRVLAQWLPAVQRSIFDHRIHTSICPGNPDYKQHYFDRTLHLIRETGLDALMVDEVCYYTEANCCGCAECRETFHRETGWYLPVNELSSDLNNPASPLWRLWLEFQKKKNGDWQVDLRKAINPVRPDFAFMTYCTHRYFVEGWTNFEILRGGILYGTEILNQNVFNSARSTFSYRKLKNMAVNCYGVSEMGLVYSGDDYVTCYTGWALNNMNAQETWFLGANPQFPFLRFKDGMNRLKARPVEDVALVFSQESQSGFRSPNIKSNSWLPGKLMGLAQTLDAMHIPYGFIDESQLKREKLAKFKAVCLPAAPVLSDAILKELDAYVKNGGTLLITSPTGSMRDLGTTRETWPFSQYFGTSPETLVMSKGTRMNGETIMLAQAVYYYKLKNAPKKQVKSHLFHLGEGSTPWVMEVAVGKGRIFWFNAELFRYLYEEEWFQPEKNYGFDMDPVQNKMVQELLRKVVEKKLSCKITAPEKVLSSYYREGNKVFLHFFNHTGFQIKPGEKLPRVWPRDSFPPLTEPIQVLLYKNNVTGVCATSPDFDGERALEFHQDELTGTVSFTLPAEYLKGYTVVTVSSQDRKKRLK